MPDLLRFFGIADARLVFKIGFLILIGLYVLFTFMLVIKIKGLNRIVFLPSEAGKVLIQIFSILYFLAVLSLFILTIVIV